MNVGIDKLSGVRRRLKIEIPAAEVSREYNRVVEEFQRLAVIPGFRKGKAPLSVIEKKYGTDIEEELKRTLIPKAFREALREKDLNILSATQVENLKYEKGKALSFATHIDLVPEFKLPEYKGLTVKKFDESITEADLQGTIDSFRMQGATFKPVTDRALRQGDFATLSYRGQLVGIFGRKDIKEVLPEAPQIGEQDKVRLHLTDDAFVPGFAAQLEGLAAGASGTVSVSFPKEFAHKPLAGKKAEYAVTVHGIEEREMPEWNEDYCQRLAKMDRESFEKILRTSLARSKSEEAHADHIRQIVAYLDEKTKFDLPESAVEEETRRLVYNLVRENKMRGISEDAIQEQKDRILAAATSSALERVKTSFILGRIAREEGIEVSAPELEEEVRLLAGRAGVSLKKAMDNLEKNGRLESIEEEILHRKTIDFLLQSAIVS